MFRQKKLAVIAAGILVALLIFSVTLLPILVKNKARGYSAGHRADGPHRIRVH
ncbi:MAG: hypothetical protein PHH91_08610 [Desulfuromonadaceae bacterium]|nr:hypothetical protein [Desulfuromonadaceae bacterium]